MLLTIKGAILMFIITDPLNFNMTQIRCPTCDIILLNSTPGENTYIGLEIFHQCRNI